MKIKKSSLAVLGFLQATGFVVYVGLVSALMANFSRIFGKMDNFMAPLLFLLLFVVSAVISASLIILWPAYLFLEHKYQESIRLLLHTVFWIVLYFIFGLGVAVIF